MRDNYVIVIPNNQSQNEWFELVNEVLSIDDSYRELIVDFNTVDFLDTDDFVVLACIIELFVEKGTKVIFKNGGDGLNGHIDNIKFKNYWEDDFNRNAYTQSRNKTTLCLWKINPEMIYSYSKYAKEFFERHTNNKDLLPLSSNMDEVFNNILDHSKSIIQGYILTQYYPKKNHISFSVCDLGIGIAKSVNNYLKSINETKLEDWQAITRATELGFSVKSTPNNRGFGLNNILNMVEYSKGTLLIRSNKGYFFKQAGKNYSIGNMDVDFPGTLIKVRVDLNTFDEIDENEILMDF